MSKAGFKPYSHEATISFIKEFHSSTFSEEDFSKFDYFRQLRADSMYRAVKVEEADARECLIFAGIFVDKIKSKVK